VGELFWFEEQCQTKAVVKQVCGNKIGGEAQQQWFHWFVPLWLCVCEDGEEIDDVEKSMEESGRCSGVGGCVCGHFMMRGIKTKKSFHFATD